MFVHEFSIFTSQCFTFSCRCCKTANLHIRCNFNSSAVEVTNVAISRQNVWTARHYVIFCSVLYTAELRLQYSLYTPECLAITHFNTIVSIIHDWFRPIGIRPRRPSVSCYCAPQTLSVTACPVLEWGSPSVLKVFCAAKNIRLYIWGYFIL